MHDDLNDRLRAYGEWLDELTDEHGAHSYEHDSNVKTFRSQRPVLSRAMRRTLAAAAAVVALVSGSIVVSAVTGQETRTFAQRWSATPSDVSDSVRLNIEKVCSNDSALVGRVTGPAVIDLRGTIGLAVWPQEMSYDVCVVSVSEDQSQITVVHVSTLHARNGSEFSTVNVNGTNATVMIFAGEVLRGDLTPEECAAVDIYTGEGAVRAVEASNVWLLSVVGEVQPNDVSFHCSDGKTPLNQLIAVGSTYLQPTDPRKLCADTESVLEATGGIPTPGSSIKMSSRVTFALENNLANLYELALAIKPLDPILFQKFFDVHRLVNGFSRKTVTYESIPRALHAFGSYCAEISTKDYGVAPFKTTIPSSAENTGSSNQALAELEDNLSDYSDNARGRICGYMKNILSTHDVAEYGVFEFKAEDPYSGRFFIKKISPQNISDVIYEDLQALIRTAETEKIDSIDHGFFMLFSDAERAIGGIALHNMKIQPITDMADSMKQLNLSVSKFTATCSAKFWRTPLNQNPATTPTIVATTTSEVTAG